jgi:hypothetical protein
MSIRDQTSPLHIEKDKKTRTFKIVDESPPPDAMPVEIYPSKARSFPINEMVPESEIERIYMEIAYQSRLNNYLQYVLNVKEAHLNVLRGGSDTTMESVTNDPLYAIGCRTKNRIEAELFKEKLKTNPF